MITHLKMLIVIIYFVTIYNTLAHVMKCPESKFNCDRHKCIPESWLCDGMPDCRDFTDENKDNCPNFPNSERNKNVSENEFLCNSGTVIPVLWKCDGKINCLDGSDEDSSMCQKNCTDSEFKCDDGQCIQSTWKCNGLADCSDGSDEHDCNKTSSSSSGDKFICPDGFSIPKKWECDGDKDCAGGADEDNCEVEEKSEDSIQCKGTDFLCPTDGFCIPDKWVCDGMRECINGEDELDCSGRNCSIFEMRCGDGTCTLYSNKCNGVKDCLDGSDEVNCAVATTLEPKEQTTLPIDGAKSCDLKTHFLCKNNKCIPENKVCDGNMDCSNNEDESVDECGINECLRNNGACMHTCVNTREGYHCACDEGFKLNGKYNCEDIDECKEISGACSQKCSNYRGGFHCSCFPGYTRDPANSTRCRASQGEVFLLFSHSFDIRQLRLRDRDMTSIVEDTRSAIAMDYVFADSQILWSDNKEKKIYRANLSNTNEREVLASHEEVSADGLAVDWIHKNVYYTNRKKSAISLLSWDGRLTKTLVKEDIGTPRAIAVNPLKSYIFWTDWGIEAKIERSSLDGSNRVAIVDNPLHVRWPNGLTIDHPTERIYWCDGYLRTIYAADDDGSNLEVILHSPNVLNHPFSISVFEDRLYWTDWSRVALFSADKFTGQEILNVSAGHLLEAPKVVHVFHQYRQPKGINICLNSKCGHFCLRSHDARAQCACADGFVLDNDQFSCVVEVSSTTTTMTTTTRTTTERTSPVTTPPTGAENPTTSETSAPPSAHQQLIREEINIYREGERTSRVGFIIGGTFGAAVVVAAVVAMYVMWSRSSRRVVRRIHFQNQVYKNTTTDDYDGRGHVIGEERLFYNNDESILTDADNVPLAPKEEE